MIAWGRHTFSDVSGNGPEPVLSLQRKRIHEVRATGLAKRTLALAGNRGRAVQKSQKLLCFSAEVFSYALPSPRLLWSKAR